MCQMEYSAGSEPVTRGRKNSADTLYNMERQDISTQISNFLGHVVAKASNVLGDGYINKVASSFSRNMFFFNLLNKHISFLEPFSF